MQGPGDIVLKFKGRPGVVKINNTQGYLKADDSKRLPCDRYRGNKLEIWRNACPWNFYHCRGWSGVDKPEELIIEANLVDGHVCMALKNRLIGRYWSKLKHRLKPQREGHPKPLGRLRKKCDEDNYNKKCSLFWRDIRKRYKDLSQGYNDDVTEEEIQHILEQRKNILKLKDEIYKIDHAQRTIMKVLRIDREVEWDKLRFWARIGMDYEAQFIMAENGFHHGGATHQLR